jgi:RNA polymerase sigma factor (sigma-70 family)
VSTAVTSRSYAYVSPAVPGSTAGLPDRQSHVHVGVTSLPESASTFEHAVLPHLDAAYNFACWLTHDPVGAEDIVQEACVQAVQSSPSIRGRSGRASLLRIVRTAAYARLRARTADIEVVLGGVGEGDDDDGVAANVAATNPGPRAVLSTAYHPGKLNAAVVALPVGLRECLVLRELEDLSYQEIARITGVPVGTVVSRLYRARRVLMAE